MKQIILIIFISSCLGVLIQACKKDSVEPGYQRIAVNLKVNQYYQFELGAFGIEEGAGIGTQASHFLVSTVYRDSIGNTPNVFYKYVPSTNYVGKDEVILQSMRGSNGASANTTYYTVITFTIAN